MTIDKANKGTFMLKGKEYRLFYPMGAYAQLQRYFKEKYGTGNVEKAMQQAMEEMDLDAILQLIAIGINFGGDRAMTKEHLGEIMTMGDMMVIQEQLTEALVAGMPSEVEEKAMTQAMGKDENQVSPIVEQEMETL